MSSTLELAVANVRGQGRRLLSALVAIMLSAAFITTTLALGDTLRHSISETAAGTVGDASAVVTVPPKKKVVPQQLPDQIRAKLPDAKVTTVARAYLWQSLKGRKAPLFLQSTPTLSETTTLTSGRLPQARGEIAMADEIARARGMKVGQTVTLVEPSRDSTPVTARIVGTIHPGTDVTPTSSMSLAFAADADIWAWSGNAGYDEVLVTGPGTQQQVHDAVAGLPGAQGMTVQTGQARSEALVKDAITGVTAITTMLMVFAVVAVFVAALVISNTFAILVAQRTRQLALLRCIGAERSQVRGSVVLEALVIGLVGSVLGVALGIGLAAGAVQASKGSPMALGTLQVTPLALLVPIAVGVLVTLVASLAPARAATRVAPLAALRPTTPTRARSVTRLRLGLGLALVVAGFLLLEMGARQHTMALGVPGGLASFVGMLVVAPVLVPALSRVIGLAASRLGGVPGELAVENSRRNPQRAAATAGALLVGVTLITMMLVGAATGVRSANAELDAQAPVDALVTSKKGLTKADLQTVRDASVVHQADLSLTTTQVVLTSGSHRLTPKSVVGMGDTIPQVTRDRASIEGFAANAVLLRPGQGISTGDQVTLTRGQKSVRLVAHVAEGHPSVPVVHADAMATLDPNAPADIWVAFNEGLEPLPAGEQLSDAISGIAGNDLTNIASQRAENQKIIDTVLLVVMGLLGVAVLIAVVGIGNTLGLSVLERTQESGLLRALGLTRGQLRSMLGLEALTLAGVGTLVGIGLGVAYGIAGAHALLGADATILVEVPWLRLVAVAAVALLAGWLASVVPGRRASRVSPAAALAIE